MISDAKITIGSITFNDFSNPTKFYKVDNLPELLTTLSTESSQNALQGDHGVSDSLSYYGPRTLPFSGEIIAPTQAERIAMERALHQELRLHAIQDYASNDGYILVLFELEDGTELQCYAKIMQPPAMYYREDKIRPHLMRRFSFSMIAKDPRLYSQTLSEETGEETYEGTNFSVIQGSSPTVPFQLYQNTVVTATCDNGGNFDAPPAIVITGPTDGPVITNVTTGKFIDLDGLVLEDGESVTIDVAKKTILKNDDTDLSAYFASGSTWLVLVPGENDFELLDDSPSELEAGCTIYWRDAYIAA